MNQWHFGVAVGINRYPGIRDLNFAKNDAQDFARWLADPAGGDLPPENIACIVTDDARMSPGTDVFDAAPNSREVFKALKVFRDKVNEHLKDSLQDWSRTRLYIYFSGHGIAPVASEAALLMADASASDYGENIACSLLLDYLLKHQPFREVVIFADCCRQRLTQSVPLGGFPGTVTPRNFGQILNVVAHGTFFGDLSFEPTPEEAAEPDKQRGYFTRALLDGLRGDAPGNAAGMIDSTKLGEYVKQKVGELTSQRPRRQVPTFVTDVGNPILFCRAKVLKYEARLRFVTPFAGAVELHDGKNAVIGRWDTSQGEWVIDLPNDFYQVTPAGQTDGAPFKRDGFFKIWGEKKDVEL